MAKKFETSKSHLEQINLALVYVHNNFDSNITAKDLAEVSGYSIFHFHRIFKAIVGQNINDYIRHIRLEKTSNILLYNQHQTIAQIATNSGFSTATSFSFAFKKKFEMTPKEWRKSGYEKSYRSLVDINKYIDIDIDNPQIVKEDKIPIIYMRIFGYDKEVNEIWKTMFEFAEEMNILDNPHRYIGLFHNHPSFLPYNNTRYLACIQTESNIFRIANLGKCVISKGKFAKFNFRCKHSELYEMMHLAYIKWLPDSNYEVRNFPAYVEYKNPENLLNNGLLECDFYMPIQLIL